MKISCGEKTLDVRLEKGTAIIEGRHVAFRAHRRTRDVVAIDVEGELVPVRAFREKKLAWVWCAGRVFEFEKASGTRRVRETAGDLLAPMPGLVRRVEVSPGASVTRGQILMILEAMKMEHAIRAPRDGIVSRIAFAEGEQVEEGVPLVEMT
ncbi:MAG TPA: biotin/lipoyl-containing protein [Thermoanaerobaculia bacterium]|nr:biotin/lipoyl-containing protein [Thermoanaerobaculia bacterium]